MTSLFSPLFGRLGEQVSLILERELGEQVYRVLAGRARYRGLYDVGRQR